MRLEVEGENEREEKKTFEWVGGTEEEKGKKRKRRRDGRGKRENFWPSVCDFW